MKSNIELDMTNCEFSMTSYSNFVATFCSGPNFGPVLTGKVPRKDDQMIAQGGISICKRTTVIILSKALSADDNNYEVVSVRP